MEKIIRTKFNLILISAISIFVMYIVDRFINPGYTYKSAIKLIVFLLVPIIYTYLDKNINIKSIFNIKSKRQFLMSIILGIGVYITIIGAYLVLRKFINLDNIKSILEQNLSLSKDNFIWVAFYISFINSLLEEFFFRGFMFLNLKKFQKKINAYLISAIAFAVYHVAIMANWFNPYLFILAMVGLFVGAIIFNFLNDKSENLFNSWLVHMFANFAINTVGFIMFGII